MIAAYTPLPTKLSILSVIIFNLLFNRFLPTYQPFFKLFHQITACEGMAGAGGNFDQGGGSYKAKMFD
jgi:hypothetical protein